MRGRCTSIVYQKEVDRKARRCGGVIMSLAYEHSNFRNDADSGCYICAGMYTMYLNKRMLV